MELDQLNHTLDFLERCLRMPPRNLVDPYPSLAFTARFKERIPLDQLKKRTKAATHKLLPSSLPSDAMSLASVYLMKWEGRPTERACQRSKKRQRPTSI